DRLSAGWFYVKLQSPPGLPFHPEAMELPRGMARRDCDLLDLDHRIVPCMGEPDKICKRGRGALGYHLHGTVRHILHVPVDPGFMGAFFYKMAVSHSLHPSPGNGRDPLHTVLLRKRSAINLGKRPGNVSQEPGCPSQGFERLHTLQDAVKGSHFDDRSRLLPPLCGHYRGKIDIALPDRAVGIPFPVIVVDVHVADPHSEKSRQAPVEVRMPDIKGERCPVNDREVFRGPQVEEVHVPHVLEREGERELAGSTGKLGEGFSELAVGLLPFLLPGKIARVEDYG